MDMQIYSLKDIPEKIETTNFGIIYFYHLGGDIKKSVDIYANSSKEKVFCKGAVVGSASDSINITINIHNRAKKSNARVHLKTYLSNNAKFDFNGCIYIDQGAHESDSYLQQDNLVSSDSVICNTSPQLEIKANDVKASHGATVANFNRDELFYFESRGIGQQRAKSELANGFLLSVYGKDAVKVLEYLKKDKLV